MNLRHVKSGEAFNPTASTHNAFVDAARAHQAGSAAGINDGAARQWTVLVHNTSKVTLKRFDAVELIEPIITDAQDAPAFDRLAGFKVAYPDDPTAGGMLAMVQAPIGAGKTGRAIVFGVSPAREIQVGSEAHGRARFGVAGELVSADDGPAVILWTSPPGQTPRRGVVAVVQGKSGQAPTEQHARIELSASLSPNRWIYGMRLVERNSQAGWDDIAGAQQVYGYNTLETANSGSGIQGNGVDADKLPDGFGIVPIGVGAVVSVTGPHQGGPFGTYYQFEQCNLVDGECTP